MKTQIIIAATLGLALPAFAQDETALTMEEVPAAAMEAAQANANGVEFETVQMDPDAGTDTYEFQGTMASGMMFEVDVLADGTIEEIEEEISMEDVPGEVSTALEENLAGFEPTFIEKSTREEGATIVYEFEGEHDGTAIDAEINADGSGFAMNEDLAG